MKERYILEIFITVVVAIILMLVVETTKQFEAIILLVISYIIAKIMAKEIQEEP